MRRVTGRVFAIADDHIQHPSGVRRSVDHHERGISGFVPGPERTSATRCRADRGGSASVVAARGVVTPDLVDRIEQTVAVALVPIDRRHVLGGIRRGRDVEAIGARVGAEGGDQVAQALQLGIRNASADPQGATRRTKRQAVAHDPDTVETRVDQRLDLAAEVERGTSVAEPDNVDTVCRDVDEAVEAVALASVRFACLV